MIIRKYTFHRLHSGMEMEGLEKLSYSSIMQIMEFLPLNLVIGFLANKKNIHKKTPEPLKEQFRNTLLELGLPEQPIQGTIGDFVDQYQSIGRLDDCTIKLAVSNIDVWEAVIGPIETWDVGNVTDMSYLFLNNKTFNKNISAWNTRNVTKMRAMFGNAKAYNQPVDFDMLNVTDASYMLYGASSFDQSNLHTFVWYISKTNHMLYGTVIDSRILFTFITRCKQLDFKMVSVAIANLPNMFSRSTAPFQVANQPQQICWDDVVKNKTYWDDMLTEIMLNDPNVTNMNQGSLRVTDVSHMFS